MQLSELVPCGENKNTRSFEIAAMMIRIQAVSFESPAFYRCATALIGNKVFDKCTLVLKRYITGRYHCISILGPYIGIILMIYLTF